MTKMTATENILTLHRFWTKNAPRFGMDVGSTLMLAALQICNSCLKKLSKADRTGLSKATLRGHLWYVLPYVTVNAHGYSLTAIGSCGHRSAILQNGLAKPKLVLLKT